MKHPCPSIAVALKGRRAGCKVVVWSPRPPLRGRMYSRAALSSLAALLGATRPELGAVLQPQTLGQQPSLPTKGKGWAGALSAKEGGSACPADASLGLPTPTKLAANRHAQIGGRARQLENGRAHPARQPTLCSPKQIVSMLRIIGCSSEVLEGAARNQESKGHDHTCKRSRQAVLAAAGLLQIISGL